MSAVPNERWFAEHFPASVVDADETAPSNSTSHPTETLETLGTSGTLETSETLGRKETHPPTQNVSYVSTEYQDATEVRGYAERHGCGGELQPAAFAIWAMRLEIEKGLRVPVRVDAASLPDELPEFMRLYWRGFLHLLECRWSYPLYHGKPAPFADSFAAVWSGVAEWQARAARDELKARGLMVQSGRSGRLKLWLPRGTK